MEAPVARKQPVGGNGRVCPNQEVGHHAVAFASALLVSFPGRTRHLHGIQIHGAKPDTQSKHGFPSIVSGREECQHLGPDRLAGDEPSRGYA